MSTLGSRTVCAFFVLVCLLPSVTMAQDDGEDAPDQQLPEIAPQEIEIRGELQLSFPSLQRQPLRGFSSPPVIPSVPEDRMPYLPSYKQELEDLPESLPAPEAVSQTVTTPAAPKEGVVEIGGGRYGSRFARGRLSLPLSSKQTLSLNADYSGTNGFSPYSGSDVSTPSDELEGGVQFESRHEALSIRAGLHGSVDDYTLYGLSTLPQPPSDSLVPGRTGYSGGPTAQLRTFGSVESSLTVSFDRTQYNTETVLRSGGTSTAAFREDRLSADGRLTVPVGATPLTVDALAQRAWYGGDVPAETSVRVDGGLSLQVVETALITAQVGGRALRFEAPMSSRRDLGNASATFLAPQGRVELSLGSGATIFAENTPSLSSGGLDDLYAHSPYVEHAPSVRPTLYTTKAESGFLFSLGPLRLEPTAGYRYAPSYRYVESPSPATPNGAFPVRYGSARIVHGGAELALQGVPHIEAAVDISVRDGTLIGEDAAIPYFSPLIAHTTFSVAFADQRGRLQMTSTIESPRPTTPTGDVEVGTYVSADLEGSYELTSLLDAVMRINNLSPGAPKRWARYARPPTTIMGGFRIHW